MMKSLLWSGLSLLFLSLFSPLVFANKTPLSNVQVSLRGKKYQVEDVTTVSELQERLAEQSGVSAGDQGRVLFNGKRLDGSESLSTAGVGDGDQLNVVPMSSKAKSKSTSTSTSTTKSSSSTSSSSSASTSSDDPTAKMKELLAQSGIDTSALEEMAKGFGGAAAAGGSGEAPSMAESMDMMTDMMNSPIFTEYMNDPEKLEQSRQMILQNPMLKSMMAGMPGMEELLNDPDAWREAMQAAASMYQNMDKDDLMKAMMMGGGAGGGGMGGMGRGMPPGLFDGMDMSTTTTALDELSEGED